MSAETSTPSRTGTTTPAGQPVLRARNLSLGYGRNTVIKDLDLEIENGKFTAVIGPNGCGKSTLLSALARLLAPQHGEVTLDGKPVGSWKPKAYARKVSLLSQESVAPSGITVAQLVARGRFPHQAMFAQHNAEDDAAVREALAATGTLSLATRRLADLSGGQRQRIWVATTLAQRAPIMLLDEPTTFLDVAHQVDLLDLFAAQRRQGHTVVAVLHDINQAIRYADTVVLLDRGRIVAHGDPRQVINAQNLGTVFGVDCEIHPDPVTGGPMMVTVPAAP
ncbi:ABC transporter ATP-binding protein [Glutamicibacter sp. MNS18]|uniref:ABC transporter ATP-binding protein n=1 Tax=Glutamicibacter sp. MNS18 TaxID=2989817 RepID=UPI002235C5B1|nr:ABC transporter ATP-binding protein [Glutamicibacter sp. MNS18]MCW4467202.1 ABC transporter ATP-binding protein [Glutamicibacter sp. MNS18]